MKRSGTSLTRNQVMHGRACQRLMTAIILWPFMLPFKKQHIGNVCLRTRAAAGFRGHNACSAEQGQLYSWILRRSTGDLTITRGKLQLQRHSCAENHGGAVRLTCSNHNIATAQTLYARGPCSYLPQLASSISSVIVVTLQLGTVVGPDFCGSFAAGSLVTSPRRYHRY